MELLKRLEGRRSPTCKRPTYWGLFLCPYCGEKVERRVSGGLRDKSCGCAALKLISKASTKHGECKGYKFSKLYSQWHCMEQRCNNKNRPEYPNYGGRRISLYSDWHDFSQFKEWALRNGYKEGLEINRIDNEGNYEPENVSFVTYVENNQNKRTNVLDWNMVNILRKEKKITGISNKELSEKYGLNISTVTDVVKYRT